MRIDRSTHYVDDAEQFERHFGAEPYDDRPSLADVVDDPRAYRFGPRDGRASVALPAGPFVDPWAPAADQTAPPF